MVNKVMLLTPDEAALRLSMSRSAFYQLLLSGRIASVKIGRSRRIPVAALDAFIERLEEAAQQGSAD